MSHEFDGLHPRFLTRLSLIRAIRRISTGVSCALAIQKARSRAHIAEIERNFEALEAEVIGRRLLEAKNSPAHALISSKAIRNRACRSRHPKSYASWAGLSSPNFAMTPTFWR